MRAPAVQRKNRGLRVSVTDSSPAPIGGWNARDPVARMKPTDARWLENFWPGTSEVSLRKGAKNHVTGIGAVVKSLMGYTSPTTAKLFGATATGIYDVTTAGTAGVAVVTVGSGDFSHLLFTVLGGTYLLAVNGVDPLQMYNGTAWSTITDTTTPSITGIATSSFSFVGLFKRRLWFIEKNSMSAWYLPVNSLGGAATEFPLGQLFTRGGHLVALTSWTIDGGNGQDDYLVLVTSEGEAAVYQGTDPTSATDFSLVGIYFLAEPIGKKCFIKFGGDVLLISRGGLLPLSKALADSGVNRSTAISDKISTIFSGSALSYGDLYGWQGQLLPSEDLLLVNVPTQEGFSAKQLVMNTKTKAWALFSGWNAFCWEPWQQGLYFGGNGVVAQAMTGANDFGNNIVGVAKGAFDYFGSSLNKHFKLFRPVLRTSADISIDIGLDVDFSDIDRSGSISVTSPLNYYWDIDKWDTALWVADETTRREWYTAFGEVGFCAALRLRIAAKDVTVGWSSTDFLYQKGGVV